MKSKRVDQYLQFKFKMLKVISLQTVYSIKAF